MKSLFSLKKADQPRVRFLSVVGDFSVSTPVIEARKYIPDFIKKQIADKKPSNKRFSVCPGMWDIAQAGFLICTHVDIHIKANSAGAMVKLGNLPALLEPKELSYLQVGQFDFGVVEGQAVVEEGLAKTAWKIPLPWAVMNDAGYSNIVQAASIHTSDEVKKNLFIYPGVVDHDNFHTVNLIVSPVRECEFVIPAGTPILQVIPFRREAFLGECRRAEQQEVYKHVHAMVSHQPGFYRRKLHAIKRYLMGGTQSKCPFHKEKDS